MQEVIKSFCGERGRGVARGEEMKNKLTEVPKTEIPPPYKVPAPAW